MALLVVDASVTLAWCFEDEASDWTEAILDRLLAGDAIVVPGHWPTEVANGLLMGLRRGRIQSGRAELLMDRLSGLPISIEPPLSLQQAKTSLLLAERYRLTIYDSAYLELAKRRGLSLATLDRELIKAASAEGIPLVK